MKNLASLTQKTTEVNLNKLAAIPSRITNPLYNIYWKALLTNKRSDIFFQKIITNFITLGFIIGILIFFYVLISGAILWMTSGSDKVALEKARGKLTSGFIGIVILFSVFAIIKIIEQFFEIDILTIDFSGLFI